jgi:hypothetical protein
MLPEALATWVGFRPARKKIARDACARGVGAGFADPSPSLMGIPHEGRNPAEIRNPTDTPNPGPILGLWKNTQKNPAGPGIPFTPLSEAADAHHDAL